MARSKKNGNGTAAVAELEREIEELMSGLEQRIDRLNNLAKRESKQVSDEISDFVSETIASMSDSLAGRVREGARTAGDEAAQFGGDALRRIIAEVDKR